MKAALRNGVARSAHAILILLSILCAAPGSAEDGPETGPWASALDRSVPAVVAIRVAGTRPFDTERASVSNATGFVVDAERGLILTNRHVVMSGPVTAEAVFFNHEKVKIHPLYRDPVHDFGFYRFDPADVRFMELREIRLSPERARVGREIRIIGNDAGEKLSILAGTLARLDRRAPRYGASQYNDFNTFYYQAASGTSGGSSGSPVIDRRGDALALNAGANRSAASSFFLPLHRVVRALALLQEGKDVPRGTIQTVFVHESYDELRRLGLPPEIERDSRERFPSRSGLLVVGSTVAGSAARANLAPGDVLLDVDGQPSADFSSLEGIFDEAVGREVSLRVARGGEILVTDLPVEDLHALTPAEYLEWSGAVIHPLSYQQARNHGIPPGSLYVASSGYALARGGIRSRTVLTHIDGEEATSLDHLEELFAGLYDGERIPVRFFRLREPRNPQIALVTSDRRWFPMKRCWRDDRAGRWPCEPSPASPPAPTFGKETVAVGADGPKALRVLAPSLVFVEFFVPYKTDGVQATSFSGAGLIVDAERGLVVADRDTVPIALGDLKLTFGGQRTIPAEVLLLHPEHNFVLLRYDPALLGDTKVRSAKLRPRALSPGEKVWLVGLTARQELVARKTQVERRDPVVLPIPNPPRFRETNALLTTLTEFPQTVGGVLADRRGRVRALWSSFSTERDRKASSFFGGFPIDAVVHALDSLEDGEELRWRTLGVELTLLRLADARARGLSLEESAPFSGGRGSGGRVLAIRRIAADAPARKQLREGDLLLGVAGEPALDLGTVERRLQQPRVALRVFRDGRLLEIEAETLELSAKGTEHAMMWAGALLQDAPRFLATQRGLSLDGVYVAARWRGSPSERYGLQPTMRITNVNGRETPDLETFRSVVGELAEDPVRRLGILDLNGQPRVVTLETDPHYWPAGLLSRSGLHE